MNGDIWRHRAPLEKFRRKLETGAVTIGFLGGSITDAAPGHNWPEKVLAWLTEAYPGVRFTVENAAIGATGSDLGCFRARRDIIDRDCDLVFVEYAVNDYYGDKENRKRSREGLLRQLLAWGEADVVLVYTFLQAMYQEMAEGGVPDSVAELELLAEHYGIGSVWVGLYAFEEVRLGRMDWDEWLPDGLHPTHRGSLSYAQSVIAFLEKELREEGSGRPAAADERIEDGKALPEPINAAHWGSVSQLPFAQVATEGPWTIRRSSRIVWIDQMLATSAVGARLSFPFEGTGLALAFDFGKRSAGFRYRIDGGEPAVYVFDRQDWCPDEGMFHLALVARDLPPGQHRADLEVVHGDGPGCTGTRFKLAFIGVIQESR
ncbi:GDSL-type esterase/lipase family protein [Cohnella soli]|uniref:GDSL-type esterase/lipase family protein n=1 Tax=Cohnella soli TaxID=425005 RepID=A0ABW0HW50_9BACL